MGSCQRIPQAMCKQLIPSLSGAAVKTVIFSLLYESAESYCCDFDVRVGIGITL